MDKLFARLFQRYGAELILNNGAADETVSGVFFSVNSRSWQNMERAFIALGEIPRGQYICILPAELTVKAGYTVRVSGTTYEIRRAETVRAVGTPVYYWCLCVERGGWDTW